MVGRSIFFDRAKSENDSISKLLVIFIVYSFESSVFCLEFSVVPVGVRPVVHELSNCKRYTENYLKEISTVACLI